MVHCSHGFNPTFGVGHPSGFRADGEDDDVDEGYAFDDHEEFRAKPSSTFVLL